MLRLPTADGKPMRLRRCAHLLIEPRERRAFDLALIARGGSGLHMVAECFALVPHLAGERVVTPDEVSVLLALSATEWQSAQELGRLYPPAVIDALREKLLLVEEGSAADGRDRRVRDTHWRA